MRKKINYTLEDQINLSMSYISYTGEMLLINGKETVDQKILADVQKNIALVKELCLADKPDWEVVWGPATYTFKEALFQSNMMFVARRISDPSNYIIAIRGTNIPSIIDWIKEDFDVWNQVEWEIPEGCSYEFEDTPKISKSTARGLDILINKLVPAENIPGEGLTLTDFLKAATSEKSSISITGHSLGGALTSALALYLMEHPEDWDSCGNTDMALTTFASPTIGNSSFAGYFDTHLGNRSRRVWNTLDIIPHAWETSTLNVLPDIYKEGGIEIPWSLGTILKIVESTVPEYKHTCQSDPFTWLIDKEESDYIPQAFDQHAYSYPAALKMPVLVEIFKENIPKVIE